jgi:hypothetical protein
VHTRNESLIYTSENASVRMACMCLQQFTLRKWSTSADVLGRKATKTCVCVRIAHNDVSVTLHVILGVNFICYDVHAFTDVFRSI